MAFRFINLIFCLLILFSVQEIYAQKKSKFFMVPGRVKMDKGDPGGIGVTLLNLQSNIVEKTLSVGSGGKFDLELKYHNEYKLSLAKEGYYTKDILISTVIPSNVWQKDSIFPPFYIVVNLFRKVPDTTLSFEGKTIGKISYSPKGGLDNFDSENYLNDKDIKDEIETALKDSRNGDFNVILTAALDFEKASDLKAAYQKYLEANKIKPGDKFVSEKIKDLTIDLKNELDEAKLLAEFNHFMELGIANVEKKSYLNAVLNFKDALKVKPGELTAVAKLKEAELLFAEINAQKEKAEAEFNRLLVLGDESVSKQLYSEAISSYSGALKIKPGDAACTAKLASAEKLLAEANAEKTKLEENFKRLLASGDKNVTDQKYPEAISDYKGALSLKPEDAAARQKLSSVEGLLAKLTAEKAKVEEEFNRLLVLGDESVSKQLYPEAISSYSGALKIKPGDAAGVAKLASAEKLLARANADKAKLEENFRRLLASGDKKVTDQKYPEAISDYKGALSLKPEDAAARQKLSSVEGLLAKLTAEKAKAEEEFNRLLVLGDENVSKQLYPEAISSYSGALKIKPGDAAGVAKLASAEKLLAQANLEKAKIEENFKGLLASGDKNVTDQKYPEAISDYKGALSLKPEDTVASQKLSSAEGLLAKLTAEKAKAEEEFNRLLVLGDESVSKQLYPEAISSYSGALKIKPGDAACTAKLASAEKLLAQANAEKTKLEENFKRLLASGDKNVTDQKYPEAISDYKGALSLKPEDAAARQKLSSVEGLLAKLTAEKAKAEEEFNRLLVLGDESVSKQLYPEAISSYSGALKIKPGDAACTAKLSSAEGLLAKLTSEKAKVEEEKAKAEAEFNRLLASGDKNSKDEKYLEAIRDYKGALSLKPGDVAARQKLSSAEGLLAKLTAEKAKAEEERAKAVEEFNRLLALGDENVTKQLYPEAISSYNGALKIKPGDPITSDKLKVAMESLAKKNESVAFNLSESQKKDNSFQLNIAKGDENYKKSQWANARFYYIEALSIKPEDKYSMSRVESCDKMIDANITAEKLQEYDKLISKGNDAFKSADYATARFYYRSSLAVLSWEIYPQSKLREIDLILNEKLTMQEKQTLKENMDKADEAFNKKEYSIARFFYHKANEISKDEYSLSRLKEIENIVNGYEEKRINTEYSSFIQKANEAIQQKNFSLARYYYQKAVTLKPNEAYAKEELKKLNYSN